MRKNSYEYVENYFKKNGCKLISSEYRGAKFLLVYECNCNKVATISFSNFKAGKKCKECGIKKVTIKQKHSYDYVKNYFLEKGCELLSKEYINAASKLIYKCVCGNISKTTLNSFRSGSRCRECGTKKTADKKRLNYKYIKNYYSNLGCSLLEVEYKNSRTQMIFECSCGENHSSTFINFKKSPRCRSCSNEILCNKIKLQRNNHEDISNYFKEKNCILLTHYESAHQKLKYICICGKEKTTTWNGFCGQCYECGMKEAAKNKKLSQKYVSDYFDKQGCKLIGKYEGCECIMEYICVCGNQDTINWSSFKGGQRCHKCGEKSKSEKMSGENHPFWIKDRNVVKQSAFFRTKCKNLLKCCLKATNQKKTNKTFAMLGYNSQQLQNHITNHVDWTTLKDKKWHIDHIFPISAFLKYNITDPKIVNCLNNLRPMLDQDNLTKGNKYNKLIFENWLIGKNQVFISKL